MAIEKKLGVVPPSQGPLSSRYVDGQRKANAPKTPAEKSNNAKTNAPTKNNTVSPSTINKSTVGPLGPRILAGPTGPNVDERLRLAKERREEQEKLLASRELGRLEREQRARRYYELQLESRKTKLLEQRVKEEGRRAAVEEKRKQRQREEKERYESAVRKTLEKSQRLQHNLLLNSRGRLQKKSAGNRSPLTAWERNLVSRLLTPTCSYLARSRSAACLSGQEVVHVCPRSVSCHSMNTTPKNNQAIHHPKPPQQTGPARQSGPARQTRPAAPPIPGSSKPRSHSVPQIKAEKQNQLDKKSSTRSNAGTPPVRARSAPTKASQTTLTKPSPQRTPRRPIRRQSFSMPPDLPSVPEEELPVCVPASSDPALDDPAPSGPALSPGNARPVILPQKPPPGGPPPGAPEAVKGRPEPLPRASSRTEPDRSAPQSIAATGAHKPPEAASRPAGGGPANREEAQRLLGERRKEARLQREQEEEESRRREEEGRRRAEQEELRRAEERSRRQAEEQARRHVEAQRLVEEKRRREEEEHRSAEEERTQAMREAALLQKKREEEQAVEREKAEQVKREREDLAQKEDAERQKRRKRLEEIMRRTRRTDAADTKPAPARITPTEALPKENTEPNPNGHTGPGPRQSTGLRPGQRGGTGIEDMVPVVAFKERRAIRTLTGLDEIQSHQRAEVI
ncbi:ensconsin-like isoform X1 [Gadus macrocephalus]|uniref:ensconsin-like isoform X1 n=1 Tax=Gadus macrocephalus TaxID=80720 RepID=UPI0028CB6525|nr:ensconsin-like isoform X1 [Gadus macrocephalus]